MPQEQDPNPEKLDLRKLNLALDGLTEEPYKPRKVELTEGELLNEIAFHEASHLVFQALICKHTDDFTRPRGIETYTNDEGIPSGQVIGFDSKIFNGGFPSTAKKLYDDLCQFYASNRLSAIYDLFSLMAGYCSYPIFVSPGESDFIPVAEHDTKEGVQLKAKYYNLENAPPSQFAVKDLYRVKHLLRCIGQEENYLSILKSVANDIMELMKRKSVNDSIRFVRNQLLKKETGGKIEGDKLEEIWEKINDLTNKVDLLEIIKKNYGYLDLE
ncbi:hypothetical protein [Flavilitoribacter nigricans]|uniref:Uncharacterized protein n=1 Tax=Flavilitoribacter nigricans (strain ATCC 23147 / DSM 23189 / NBRC 102662 / NCIMB 1420 / SS-2) TaxID=1122177 RepID=A0A2D0N897_FLAN2|nr:hypothetical protein [Flavilitoribacter nigricans]PHN04369.1 hypothetical protein CRP01_22685 [Flavilitoribacter nigricans DSM 23189 = NBRC 102662]